MAEEGVEVEGIITMGWWNTMVMVAGMVCAGGMVAELEAVEEAVVIVGVEEAMVVEICNKKWAVTMTMDQGQCLLKAVGVGDGEAGGGAVDLVGISNQMAQSRQLPEPHRFTLQIVVDACSADYVVVSLAGECWFQ